jgi:hypothetical protein
LSTRPEQRVVDLLNDEFDRSVDELDRSVGEASSANSLSDSLAVVNTVNAARVNWRELVGQTLPESSEHIDSVKQERDELVAVVQELYERLSVDGLVVLRARAALSSLETDLLAARRAVDLATEVFSQGEAELKRVKQRLIQLGSLIT